MAKVLVVEDDILLARDMHRQLEVMGHEVVGLAESAGEAILAADETRPDIVFLDVNLVGKVDGIQTAHLLRSAYRLQVVFLTSSTDELTRKRAAREMPSGFLVKPYSREAIQESIVAAMGAATADRLTALA